MRTYQSLSKPETSFSSKSKPKTSKEDEFSVTPLQTEQTETNAIPEGDKTPKITFQAIRDNINRTLEQQTQPQEEKETSEKEPELGLITANAGIIKPKLNQSLIKPSIATPVSLEMGQPQPSIMTKIIQMMTASPEAISTGNSLFAQRVFRVQDPAVPTIQADFEQKLNSARGGGLPLDQAFRARIEPAMGADFSGVKVHTDSEADRLSQSIQAKAFTTGNDIFFRKGEYSPGSQVGQELLAHELTHVVQQNGTIQRQEDDSKPWYGDLQDFGTGVWEGGKDAVTGLGSMGKGAWNLTGGWLFNPEESKSTWDNLSSTTKAVVNDPSLIWKGITQPYVEDWNSGHHAKAIGRGTFEVISVLAGTKGLDKLSKAGKIGKIANLGDKVGDTAKIADKVGDTAKIADKVGDTAKIADEITNFKMPLKSRHNLKNIKQGSVKKAKNSVVEPNTWSEIEVDITAINQGQGTRTGNIFEINSRKYELFDDHLVPIEGPGIHNLNRGEYDALGLLNKLGDTPKTREIVTKNIGLSEDNFNKLLQLWRKSQ